MKSNTDKQVARKLLVGYFFIYPFYYVVAMLLATVVLTFMFDWSYPFAKKIFFIFAGVMWVTSFVAHSDILRQGLSLNKHAKESRH